MTEDIQKKLRRLKASLKKKQKIGNRNPFSPIPQKTKPEIKYGPRGGKYTEDKTKDGRPYRRYF